MIQECKFDKSRDLGVTIHGLSPDLNKMIESGTVPDSEAEVVHNQLCSLEEVGCRVSDKFEAIMLQRSYLSQAKHGKDDNGNDVEYKISVKG